MQNKFNDSRDRAFSAMITLRRLVATLEERGEMDALLDLTKSQIAKNVSRMSRSGRAWVVSLDRLCWRTNIICLCLTDSKESCAHPGFFTITSALVRLFVYGPLPPSSYSCYRSFFPDFLSLHWSSDAFLLLFYPSFCSHAEGKMNEWNWSQFPIDFLMGFSYFQRSYRIPNWPIR